VHHHKNCVKIKLQDHSFLVGLIIDIIHQVNSLTLQGGSLTWRCWVLSDLFILCSGFCSVLIWHLDVHDFIPHTWSHWRDGVCCLLASLTLLDKWCSTRGAVFKDALMNHQFICIDGVWSYCCPISVCVWVFACTSWLVLVGNKLLTFAAMGNRSSALSVD